MGNQYAGNDGSFPPTVFVLDDSDGPNAANFDAGLQGDLDRSAFLRTRMPHAEMNWRKTFTASAVISSAYTATCTAACWDPLANRWLVAIGEPTVGTHVYASYGEDDSTEWFDPNPSAGPIGFGFGTTPAVCADATTIGICYALTLLGASSPFPDARLYVSTPSTPTWTAARTWTSGAGDFAGGRMVSFGGFLIVAIMGGTTSDGYLSSSGDNGATWTDAASGTFALGSSVRFAANAAICVLAIWGEHAPSYYTTVDGVTWVAQSATFITGSNVQVQGVAWDAARQLFVVVTQTNVGGSPVGFSIWTSPDGIAWTDVGAGPTGWVITDLAVLANGYVLTLADVGSAGPSGQLFSIDGGSTWYPSQAVLPNNLAVSSLYYTPSQYACQSTIGLLVFNSNNLRFSRLAGLPPVHL